MAARTAVPPAGRTPSSWSLVVDEIAAEQGRNGYGRNVIADHSVPDERELQDGAQSGSPSWVHRLLELAAAVKAHRRLMLALQIAAIVVVVALCALAVHSEWS